MHKSSVDGRVIRLEVAASTNDLAKRMAMEESGPLPVVIRADRQTSGRGRGANRWWSDEGSLTFSVLLDPLSRGLTDRQTPLTSLASAVAVAEVVAEWIDRGEVAIRWPNDVEIDGRKVSGILPEQVNTPEGARLVIGIGLNVRSRLDEAPEEVRRMAAALEEFRDRRLGAEDQEAIFAAVLDRLDNALDRLGRDDPALARAWADRDPLLGEAVRLDVGGTIVDGVGRGIGPDGGLRIDVAGAIRTFYGGRVLRDGGLTQSRKDAEL